MTSLQQQLSSIRAQSTQELNLKAQKVAHSKSLIFPPAEAASQSLFDIHQICVRGFKELCRLDSRFDAFAGTLFSEQSLDIERTQMSEDANEKLDKTLEGFLGLLGSRLQLRDAQCAVEWLVRRFRVHEYNSQALILSFLPHHDTNIFAVMLQLIPASKLPAVFDFMRPYISARVTFKRPILIREASRRPTLLKVLNQYVLSVSREGHETENLIGFWVDVSIQALNGLLDKARSGRQNVQRDRQNETLLEVTSVLQSGLELQDAPEVTLGCYTLAVFVARKAAIDDQWLESLLVSIAKSFLVADPSACLLCLAALSEERSERRNKLPRPVIHWAANRLPELANLIEAIGSRLSVNRLAFGIALGFLEYPEPYLDQDKIDYIEVVVERGLLTKSKTKSLISRVIKSRRDSLYDLLQRLARSRAVGEIFRTVVAALDDPHSVLPSEVLAELGDQNQALQRTIEPPAVHDVDSVFPSTALEFENLHVTDASFFTHDSEDSFNTLQTALTTVATSKKGETDVRTLGSFQKLGHQTYATFIIRVWCSSASSLIARQSAICSGRHLLRNIKTAGVGVRALTPFFLCALLDADRRTRQTAADCLLDSLAICREDEAVRTKPRPAETLGMEIDLPPLSDLKAFLKAFSSHLDSCVIDGTAATNVINRLLAGRSDQLHIPDASSSKDLKAAVRASISNLIAGCAVQSHLLAIQLRLFPMLPPSLKSGPSYQHRYIHPSFREWIQLGCDVAEKRATAESLRLAEANELFFNLLRPKDADSGAILLDIIDRGLYGQRGDLEEPTFQALVRLYRKIDAPAPLLQSLLKVALDEGAESSADSHRANARGAFLTIHASTATLGTLLSMLDADDQFPDRPTPAKRRRMSKTNGTRPQLDGAALQRDLDKRTLILEKVENSNSHSPELLGGLFHALAELMRVENATETKLDYLTQLIVRALHTIIQHLTTDEGSEDTKTYQTSVRMDTLIECLRQNSSRGTQNDILALISRLATWNPELVLHSVMPIFTFIGKNSVRQGDDYTSHVVGRTIETVIPPLATSLRKSKKSIVTALSEVLQSFTAAHEHIPSHRRLPLFGSLVRQLGPGDSLFAIIVMLVDRQGTESSTMAFLSDLLGLFDTEAEMSTFSRCLDVLLDVHAPNAFVSRRSFSETVFNTKEKNADQLQEAIFNVLSTLVKLLQRPNFRSRVARLFRQPRDSSNVQASPQALYSQLLSRSINLIQVLKQKSSDLQADARHALTSVMKLVPVAEMLPSIADILSTASDEIKITALRALEEQIQTVSQSDSAAVDALLDFVPQLSEVLKETHEVYLKQMSISCIDQIAEKFGKRNTGVISIAAQTLAGEAALGHLDISLQIVALLTLASLVDVLREEFVPLIPRVLQQAYPILDMSAGQERYGELRSALFAVINAIVECLPQMLSETDLDKALKLCHKSAAGTPIDDDTTQRQQFHRLAVHRLPAGACFSAASRNLTHAIETGLYAFPEHLGWVLALVQQHSKRVIREHATTIFRIVTEAWTVRRLQATTAVFGKLYDSDAIDRAQEMANDIAMAAINKLNDDTLRPHFISIVEWGSGSNFPGDQISRLCDATSLFSFLKVLNDKLRGLVTSYSGYYLQLARDVLSSIQPTTPSSTLALQTVLDAVASSFAGDESDYWQDPQHFEALMSPLLLQVPHFAQDEQASLGAHVFPAIRDFVSAAYSSDKRTQVNAEVLKLLRHDDPRVRLAAVQCQRELLDQVGEEWVTLVSQMLPFINEVQEDDDEDVESATREWIKDLEAGLGESMTAMLQ